MTDFELLKDALRSENLSIINDSNGKSLVLFGDNEWCLFKFDGTFTAEYDNLSEALGDLLKT